MKVFKNNMSCRPFISFIQKTLMDCLRTGAISWLGLVSKVEPPHPVLPLTVEPTKPLCHNACFLNLWIKDKPFTLDTLNDLPWYMAKDSYQTVLDDKSGYDHILLSEDSRTFLGIQWGGWYLLHMLWEISPYLYHSTGLMATTFFQSIGVPCLLYIKDRHNGQLQVQLDKGEYSLLKMNDALDNAAASSAIFLMAFHLVHLGYFLGLLKSILIPSKIVPYLGFLADSSREVFHLIPEKKAKFIAFTEMMIYMK